MHAAPSADEPGWALRLLLRRASLVFAFAAGAVLVATGLYDRLAQGSDLQLGYFLVPAVAMAAPAVLVFTGRADITTAARWSTLALGVVVVDDLG